MNIKPSNLLLDENGHAMVSDYGLPAILKKPDCRKSGKECESSKVHSCMDCTMLSPNYTAPEAWEPVKKSLHLFWDDAIGISPESDAWSFGCTLVEMCTGSIPYVKFFYYFVLSRFVVYASCFLENERKKKKQIIYVYFCAGGLV